jgi:hypothetical protein
MRCGSPIRLKRFEAGILAVFMKRMFHSFAAYIIEGRYSGFQLQRELRELWRQ